MRIEARHIKTATANVCGVTVEQLISQDRHKALARYRQIAYRLCKEMTDDNLTVIGWEFGQRDRTTIAHGVQAMDYHVSPGDRYGQLLKEIRAEAYRVAESAIGGTFRTTRNPPVFKTTRKETT